MLIHVVLLFNLVNPLTCNVDANVVLFNNIVKSDIFILFAFKLIILLLSQTPEY